MRLQKLEAELLERCRQSNEMSVNLKEEINEKIGIGSSKKIVRMFPTIKNSKAKFKQSADSFFKAQSEEEMLMELN